MKKFILCTFIIGFFLSSFYLFSAMHSLHQVHKSFYYNDKNLSKVYVAWGDVKNNFKDHINANLLDEIFNNSELNAELGDLSILAAGLARKFVEYAVETYINPEGLSTLLEKEDLTSEIPEPNFATLVGGIAVMNFQDLNSFYVDFEKDGEKFYIYFDRFGTLWKVTEIEIPKDIFKRLLLPN